jgi:hypothetical protein
MLVFITLICLNSIVKPVVKAMRDEMSYPFCCVFIIRDSTFGSHLFTSYCMKSSVRSGVRIT